MYIYCVSVDISCDHVIKTHWCNCFLDRSEIRANKSLKEDNSDDSVVFQSLRHVKNTNQSPSRDQKPLDTSAKRPTTVVSSADDNQRKTTKWMEGEVLRLQELVTDLGKSCNVTIAMHDKQVSAVKQSKRCDKYVVNLFFALQVNGSVVVNLLVH